MMSIPTSASNDVPTSLLRFSIVTPSKFGAKGVVCSHYSSDGPSS